MKKFEEKFGTPLTREQMKKIGGGVLACGACVTCMSDGGTFTVNGFDDGSGGCVLPDQAAANAYAAGQTVGYWCTNDSAGGDMSSCFLAD